jgi:hypothetical protein
MVTPNINGSINIISFLATWFPRSVISKWPAIIFAVRRMARVAGRIKFLVVSIKTITGIRTGGVPWGIKWASMDLGLFNQPYSIKPIQIGSDRAKVLVM